MAEQRKAFVFALPYDTRLDMIQQFLRIYNGYLDSKGRSLITERTINLLSFYINYGYSDDTGLSTWIVMDRRNLISLSLTMS